MAKYIRIRATEALRIGDLVTADGKKANPDNTIITTRNWISFLRRVRMRKSIEELRLLRNEAKDILLKVFDNDKRCKNV